jgi:hypothetical protein
VFGRLAGYEDENDADRLGRDPAMRWVVGGRAVLDQAASTSQMGRFETSAMTSPTNLTALADLSGHWIDRVQAQRAPTALVLDIDSSVSPTYCAEEGTAYNGHFACTCFHPIFVFNENGDMERCTLRPGNVRSAHGCREVLDPVVAPYRRQALRRLLRGDAAFALPDVYEYLEAEGFQYAIRLPANAVLQAQIAPLLTRPVGRPPHDVRRFYASFRYQAQSWTRPRREWRRWGGTPASCTRVGFIVTDLRLPARKVVAFYNGRGTAERWIKEGKNAVKWTRLSCTTFRANAVRLQLHALAYNLAKFLRTQALPREVGEWSLTSPPARVALAPACRIGSHTANGGSDVHFRGGRRAGDERHLGAESRSSPAQVRYEMAEASCCLLTPMTAIARESKVEK